MVVRDKSRGWDEQVEYSGSVGSGAVLCNTGMADICVSMVIQTSQTCDTRRALMEIVFGIMMVCLPRPISHIENVTILVGILIMAKAMLIRGSRVCVQSL